MVRATTNARSRVYAAPILNQCCAFESTKSFFNSIDPCRTHSRVLALNWRTIEWRHDALLVGTKATRARFRGDERFIKLAPQSAITRPAIPRSQAAYAGAEANSLPIPADPDG